MKKTQCTDWPSWLIGKRRRKFLIVIFTLGFLTAFKLLSPVFTVEVGRFKYSNSDIQEQSSIIDDNQQFVASYNKVENEYYENAEPRPVKPEGDHIPESDDSTELEEPEDDVTANKEKSGTAKKEKAAHKEKASGKHVKVKRRRRVRVLVVKRIHTVHAKSRPVKRREIYKVAKPSSKRNPHHIYKVIRSKDKKHNKDGGGDEENKEYEEELEEDVDLPPEQIVNFELLPKDLRDAIEKNAAKVRAKRLERLQAEGDTKNQDANKSDVKTMQQDAGEAQTAAQAGVNDEKDGDDANGYIHFMVDDVDDDEEEKKDEEDDKFKEFDKDVMNADEYE